MSLSNAVDPDLLHSHLERCLEIHDEIDAQKIANMNKVREIRARLKGRIDTAEAEGLEKTPFKLALRKRLDDRKKAKIDADFAEQVDALEGDTAETWEQFAEALGDFAETPLGAAASSSKKSAAETRAEKKTAARAQLDDLSDRTH